MGGFFSKSGGQGAASQWLMGDPNHGDAGDYSRAVGQGLMKRGMDETENLNYGQGVSAVQNNPILSQLFGAGGQMEQTNKQVTDLANRGYSLQPEDYEAYGQASGNIARMFGGQEQGLAQDMANRGLSNSGVAGANFSGLFGNKQEQLAGLQTQIAQNRMQMNTQRLGQMQNFLTNLGAQAQSGINSANQTNFQDATQKYQTGRAYIGDIQGQNNTYQNQTLASQGPSTASMISGGMGLASQGMGLVSGAAGMPGMGSTGGAALGQAPSATNSGAAQAGGSGIFGGNIAGLAMLA